MNTSRFGPFIRRYLPKVAGFILMAFLLGFIADFAARRNHPDAPAGFLWGMAHGALMPTTLPALFLGKNVTIYAPHNTGRTYNLGYTMGVNACGLIFFGILFGPIPGKKKRA